MRRDKLGRPTVLTTPSNEKFFTLSQEFLDAAKILHRALDETPDRANIATPMTFLYFRSLELALKACLPIGKIPDTDIRMKFGHKISLLIDKIEGAGLIEKFGMCRKDFKEIDDYSEDYSNKWFEYGSIFTELPNDLERISELVTKFVSNTKEYIIQNMNNHYPEI